MLRSVRIATRSLVGARARSSGVSSNDRIYLRPSRCVTAQSLVARPFRTLARHYQDTVSSAETPHSCGPGHPPVTLSEEAAFVKSLPVFCPGCGGLSQTVEPDAPGFFSARKADRSPKRRQEEDEIFQDSISRFEDLGDASEGQLKIEPRPRHTSPADISAEMIARSVCDRCHDLIHQSKGQSILHPSMESIREMIEASPYQRNHIYHVIDAADFPMSLIPNLVSSLDLPRLRTQNRRSKSTHYSHGRTADVSFVITRSDLLAPRKEQVDHMMPYLQDVLRETLGRGGKNLRLGNVRCVSAKRGWWTPSVKQEIWSRGGAGWVVGKVNVGKSALFEVVFPKGRSHRPQEAAKLAAVRGGHRQFSQTVSENDETSQEADGPRDDPDSGSKMLDALEAQLDGEDGHSYPPRRAQVEPKADEEAYAEDEDLMLLPPAQPETQYPTMPIVSALPGTTASPIRIPYGKGKGELIDLPGIHRSSIETHVLPEHRSSLIMKSRIIPQQNVIKPGQSLLIGGFIRITPKTEDLTVLAYPFTPLAAHVTANPRAIAIQTGKDEDGLPYTGHVENIATDTAKQRIRSAGIFQLDGDVTGKRAGPLTTKDAGKMKPENLPFTVYSADILIESVGWIELVCQVRNRHRNEFSPYPEVEVFTPKGKFIAVRKPMNAWLIGGPKKKPKHEQRSRPRMTISMQKRKEGGRKSAGISNPVSN